MTILITGGCGYIGSHAVVALAQAGYEILIIDNLYNSSVEVIDRIEKIIGKRPLFIEGDIRDAATLDQIFIQQKIDAVMHFAGLKAVGESVSKPIEYFDNNVNGTICLLKAMQRANVKAFVFSSSATVYGNPKELPVNENSPRSTTNPYGRSKLIVEDILSDLHATAPEWRIARLRYFNPVGAHESSLIGENPRGIPNNLMPYIAQVAAGKINFLNVWGNDYPTKDGTGIRDYIHVVDLAEGHVASLKYILENPGLLSLNLGTGRGYSVLEMINTFEKVSGRKIHFKISKRRYGDIAECWANTDLAERTIGWKAKHGIEKMCLDSWRWQEQKQSLHE